MLSCEKCNKSFSNSHTLRNHRRNFHEGSIKKVEKLSCNLSNKTFTEKHTLRRHILCIHEGSKKFQCKSCEKSYGREDLLRCHVSEKHLLGE